LFIITSRNIYFIQPILKQPLNNKIIDINNMSEQFTLFNLGPTELSRENIMNTESIPEELVADMSAASLFEAQDDALFARKYVQKPALYTCEEEENLSENYKRLKTFHDDPISEPMDICESSEKWLYSCCSGCVLTDGQIPLEYCRRAYPDRIADINSDSDEEREIDEYDPQRFFRYSLSAKEEEDCGHGVINEICYDCIWFLEQEAKRRYPRRIPQRLEEVAVQLFEDESEEVIMPVLEDLTYHSMPVLQRQNTQFSVNGITVFNGNSNGSRFFAIDDKL